jgi:hypothetical protein
VYKSFQRQLNLYGFVCLPRGDDKGAYFHKNFVRGERYLCHYIVRKKDQRSTPRTSAAKKAQAEQQKQQAAASSAAEGATGKTSSRNTRRRSATRRTRTQQPSSLHSRQQEALALLDRQVGDSSNSNNNTEMPPAPQSSAPFHFADQQQQQQQELHSRHMRRVTAPQLQGMQNSDNYEEQVPEDIMKVFNSIEVPPLECPSVGMFDEEDEDIQIAKKQSVATNDKEFQNEVVSLFGEEPAPVTNSRDSVTMQSGVPQFVSWNSNKFNNGANTNTNNGFSRQQSTGGESINFGDDSDSIMPPSWNFKDPFGENDARGVKDQGNTNSRQTNSFGGNFGGHPFHFEDEAPSMDLQNLLDSSREFAEGAKD